MLFWFQIRETTNLADWASSQFDLTKQDPKSSTKWPQKLAGCQNEAIRCLQAPLGSYFCPMVPDSEENTLWFHVAKLQNASKTVGQNEPSKLPNKTKHLVLLLNQPKTATPSQPYPPASGAKPGISRLRTASSGSDSAKSMASQKRRSVSSGLCGTWPKVEPFLGLHVPFGEHKMSVSHTRGPGKHLTGSTFQKMPISTESRIAPQRSQKGHRAANRPRTAAAGTGQASRIGLRASMPGGRGHPAARRCLYASFQISKHNNKTQQTTNNGKNSNNRNNNQQPTTHNPPQQP